MDRPFWGVDDPGMPLPFDLADIITRVESLLWRLALHTLLKRTVSHMLVTGAEFDIHIERFTFVSYRDFDFKIGAQARLSDLYLSKVTFDMKLFSLSL